MAIRLINVGFNANDGTGDDLREAFVKINENFEELDLRNDEKTVATNLGNVGEGVFAQVNNYELQFKKLVAGKDITLSSNPERILIEANGGLKRLLVLSDSGSAILDELAEITFAGGENITTNIVDGKVYINYDGPKSLIEDNNPTLSTDLNANSNDINNVGTLTADTVIADVEGDVTGLVHGIDIRELDRYFDANFDFGEISQTASNIIDWIIAESVVDMGTITNPELKTIDGGSL